MKFFIETHFIDKLKQHENLLHCFTPRSFNGSNNDRIPLCLGRTGTKNINQMHQKLLLKSLKIQSEVIHFVNQVHGNQVYVLQEKKTFPEVTAQIHADAIVTQLSQIPIAIMTADCIPILLFDPIGQVIGVVHAGRVGTQKEILSKTIEIMAIKFGSSPKDLVMGMGPGICKKCYEVDEICVQPFLERPFPIEKIAEQYSSRKYLLDLFKANQLEAIERGIISNKIFQIGECTSCNNDKWYSYRKEGQTGRNITLAMLKG